jgi:hypothetical protein
VQWTPEHGPVRWLLSSAWGSAPCSAGGVSLWVMGTARIAVKASTQETPGPVHRATATEGPTQVSNQQDQGRIGAIGTSGSARVVALKHHNPRAHAARLLGWKATLPSSAPQRSAVACMMAATIQLRWAAAYRSWVRRFREDQVLRGMGWPVFEMRLENHNAPVSLRESQAWCRVLEFAEEFGNSRRESLWQAACANGLRACATRSWWARSEHLLYRLGKFRAGRPSRRESFQPRSCLYIKWQVLVVVQDSGSQERFFSSTPVGASSALSCLMNKSF